MHARQLQLVACRTLEEGARIDVIDVHRVCPLLCPDERVRDAGQEREVPGRQLVKVADKHVLEILLRRVRRSRIQHHVRQRVDLLLVVSGTHCVKGIVQR